MIDIYGDSFADPNWDPEDSFVWHKRLASLNDRVVNNFAKSATCPHNSLKLLYKRYKNYTIHDHIIFIISGRDRINYYVPDDYKDEGIRPEDIFWDANKYRTVPVHDSTSSRFNEWYSLYGSHMDYSYKTFKEEIDNITVKCESFLYMISRLQRCKVTVFLVNTFDSYMKDSLNDDLFYLHNYSLTFASNEEFIGFDSKTICPTRTNRVPKYERRQNHLSKENHDIMVDIIKTRTYKPFKKGFVDPVPFEQDQERFIYD